MLDVLYPHFGLSHNRTLFVSLLLHIPLHYKVRTWMGAWRETKDGGLGLGEGWVG